MAENTRNSLKSVKMTVSILQGLKELGGAGVTELATHLDVPKSTAYSYLRTLEQEEYVVKNGENYNVAVRLLEYGEYARNRTAIYEIAKPEIDRLAADTGNLANLMIEEHGLGVYLYRGEGEHAVRALDTQVGSRVHLHSTAMGKAILANTPPESVETILEARGLPTSTSNTITDRDVLWDELERVRKRGYATDDEELVEGLRCIGVPIFDASDSVRGAVSVAGPTHRFNGSYFDEELPAKVLETANIVELNLVRS